MKNKIILLFVVIAIFIIFLGVWFALIHQAQSGLARGVVTINNQTVNVEIAKTESQQELGLGYRKALAANSGMLFVFPDYQIRSFWMKGMEFPLDMIWIKDNQIIDITENIPAPTAGQTQLPIYQPKEAVNYVLEVNAGFCANHKIQIGDEVKLEFK